MTTVDPTAGEIAYLALYGSFPGLLDRLPPKPSGGWTWDDLSPSEQALIRPPAWMRPCQEHGRRW